MLGKVINTILTNSASLTALVPSTSIYPYVINENTPLPAIIYTIDSLSPEYDKDGWAGDIYDFSIISFSDNYSLLQDIILQIRNTLELIKGTYNGIKINRVQLEGLTEGYNITENCFLSRLTFSVQVVDY